MWQLTVVAFCCIVGAKLGSGYQLFFDASREFFEFKINIVNDTSLITCLKVLPVGIMLSLVSSLIASRVVRYFGVYNNMQCEVNPSLIQNIKDSSLINFVFFILFFEEGIFRLIPILISSYTGANIVWLLLIFNLAFALVHIDNFETRNPFATIPQFCCGLVISIAAFKFGFITAVIIHLYFDFVLFSTDRKTKYNTTTFVVAIYYGFIALLGLWLSSSVLYILQPLIVWQGPIPNDLKLNYTQAIGIIMVTYGVVKCFGNLAALDNISTNKINNLKFNSLLFFAVLGTIVNIIFSYLSSWLILNPLADYPLVSTLVFALLFVGFNRQNSLSEGAFHAFKIPVSALSLLIYAIVGPVVTFQLAITELLITLPDLLIYINSEDI